MGCGRGGRRYHGDLFGGGGPGRAGAEERGTETIASITVTAEADVWRGVPADLTWVIPLLVTIENSSTRPLRLRYTLW